MTTLNPVRQQFVPLWGKTSARFIWDLTSVDIQMPANAEPLPAVYLLAAVGGSK
jgi:hypothetical protein